MRKNDNKHDQNSVFCLASIICLPHRFVHWLRTFNRGFQSPSTTKTTVTHSSPLNWIKFLALNSSVHLNDSQIIQILPDPHKSTTGRRYGSKRFQQRKSTVTVDDGKGLDVLWTDPNRAPVEIYADFETTQVNHFDRCI